MKIEFKYDFHDKGTNAGDVPDGHIWLDVGNTLKPGVIDHHSSDGYSCTAEALQKNLDLLSGIKSHLKDHDSVVLNTHKFPDADALFSMWLVQYYLDGRRHELPKNIDAIVKYVSEIDKGFVKIANRPVTLYQVLSFQAENYRDPYEFQKCLDIITIAIDKNAHDGFSFMDGNILEGMADSEELQKLKEQILGDYDNYEKDRDMICKKSQITLPASDNYTVASPEKVRALIWTAQPTCKHHRLWARHEGYELTVVPMADKSYSPDEKSIVCTDIIISLKPELAEKYSLRPLAVLLEQYEQEKERSVLGEENNTKRDHSSPRGEQKDGNRFFEKPWSLTADPWYFTGDGTLVQSPHSGSLLSLREVIHIVETFGECFIKEYRMNILVPLHTIPYISATF